MDKMDSMKTAVSAFAIALLLVRIEAAETSARKARIEPQILSTSAISASRGTRAKLEVRGKGLAEAHGLIFDCSALNGEIKSIEDKSGEQKLTLEISIGPDAGNGVHTFRLVSPMGVTSPRSLLVHHEVAILEEDLPTDVERPARRLPPAPIVVLGKVGAVGEVDFYAFDAEAGEQFSFEVYNDRKFDAQLFIYERAESWFDPHALNRLAFNDEPNRGYGDLNPVLSYRFEKKGRYLAAVSAFLGGGGADHFYALRVIRGSPNGTLLTGRPAAHTSPSNWEERKFIRTLGENRLADLRARSIPAAEGDLVKLTKVPDAESAGAEKNLREITIPSEIEGAFDVPGDIDRFRFKLKDGALLAVEIETPDRPAPLCTPRVAILDDSGQEVLNNIFAWVEGSGEFIGKAIESKVIGQFVRGGEYSLEIKDLTTRNGGPDYRYKVIIREQMPHIGKVTLATSFGRGGNGMVTRGAAIDHLNLAPGEVRKISIMTEMEEGYNGQVVFSFENFPTGVETHPAAELEPERPRILDEGKKERFRPNYGAATLLLMVSSNAPATRLPHMVQVWAKPVLNGKSGRFLSVQTLPLMIVRPDEPLPHLAVMETATHKSLAPAPDAN
jgi:hypothetical protein